MASRSRSVFDLNYLIHHIDPVTEDIIETLAAADHFDVAKAAFDAVLKTRTRATIQLRQKARIIMTEKSP